MKYVQPYGITDPNAPYINGNPSIGLQGSIPPAAAFEHPMREIVGVIQKSQIAPSEADLLQMAKAIRSQRLNYAEDSGGVNSVVVAYDPPIGAYTLGLTLHVKIRNNTTGPSTINAGAGVTNIVRANGAATQANDLVAGQVATLVYDGTRFQIVNYRGIGGDGGGGDTIENTYITKLPYAVDTSNTAGIITVAFTPVFTALAAGDAILVKLKNTIPGPTVINIDALPAVQLRACGGPNLLQGDAAANDVMFLRYDGTNFWFDPQPSITATEFTMNVPSQYATVPAAFTALKRKLIAPGAHVTIKLAVGIYPAFVCDHHNANRITVQGTMLAPPPAWNNFSLSGPSAAARAADSAANIGILRGKYGTEIQTSGVSTSCVQNLGAGGALTLRDLLVTGPNYQGSNTAGVYAVSGDIFCDNVASWGHDWGFICFQSSLSCNACHAVSNHSAGYYSDASGRMSLQVGCSGHSNGAYGILSNNHGAGGANSSYFICNGQSGIACGDHSHFNLTGCNLSVSGIIDQVAYNLSEIYNRSATNYSTTSPAQNTMGNNGSLVTWT